MNENAIRGVIAFTIGGYFQLLSAQQISLNGYYEIFWLGGILDIIGWALIGSGLYFLIVSAINAGKKQNP